MKEGIKLSHIGRNKNLLEASKNLRKNMTKQEKHLWYDFLNEYPVRWYRQRIIESFIVDFYCATAKLVVELDGSQHYEKEAMEYDEFRTEIINKYEIEVLRFSNYDVDNNFEGVCTAIDKAVKERLLP
jgi:very-short-patch-repair endonuclease